MRSKDRKRGNIRRSVKKELRLTRGWIGIEMVREIEI
jgi:hypothetical protein